MTNKTVVDALLKAQQFEDDDKFEEAYECYKYAHNIDKNDTDVIQKLAVCAQTIDKSDDAKSYWQLLMELKPEDPISYTQLLDIYFLENKYLYYMTRAKLKVLENRLVQATDDYKKAISNTTEEKETIEARYLLAQTYEYINRPMQAIDEYLKILDHEHNENVYISLAGLYYKEDKSAALNILQKAIIEYPDSEPIREFLCQAYLVTGKYSDAEKYAVSKFNKIKAMLMQEKNGVAFAELNNLSDKEKQDISYSALMAEYYYNIEDNENALLWIDKFEKMNPNNPLPYQMRALLYEKQNNEFESYFNWGKYHVKKNDLDLALNDYLNAYNTNSSRTDVIRELINLYSALNDNFACAEFCEKLVKIDKTDIATLKRLVKFYEEQGYQDKVVEYLLQLTEINNKDYSAYLKLGEHAEKSRRINEAIEYYNAYIKYAPNSDEKDKIKSKLELLLNGETYEEEGFLDKIIRLFAKK